MSERIRLQDVATRAGVSLTTASHALSGHRPVAAMTRAAVLQAAFDLGFTADAPSQTTSIGLLPRPPETLPGFSAGTESIARLTGTVTLALLARGFSVVSFERLSDIGMQIGRLSGFVLLYPNRRDEVLSALLERDIPAVTYDPDPGEADFSWWVGSNYFESGRMLMRHLVARGARRIALIAGRTENTYMTATVRAYFSECDVHGMRPIVARTDASRAVGAGRNAARTILGEEGGVDAILTTSSMFAVGVLETATALRRRVPDDLMIATMTDGPLAEKASAPITALRVDTVQAAARVADLLERRLQGVAVPAQPRLELELIERLSTMRGASIAHG